MELEVIIKISSGIAGLIATVFAIRKFYKWLLPVQIAPGYSMCMDETKPNAIIAKITNCSTETLYITKCEARGTLSLWHIMSIHIKNPLIKPRLYKNVRYIGSSYRLSGETPIKLEAGQPIDLMHSFQKHPIWAMHTPYFVVLVTLSSGRTIRSKKVLTPKSWRRIGE